MPTARGVSALRSLAVMIAAVALLTGCTQPSRTMAHPVTKPSPIATVAPPVAPTSRIGVTCADIATATNPTALLSQPTSVASMSTTTGLATPEIPFPFAIQQAGGLTCEWSKGTAETSPDVAYWGVRIELLPGAPEWQKMGNGGLTAGDDISCGVGDNLAFPTQGICSVDRLTSNGVWIEVELRDPTNPLSAAALTSKFTTFMAQLTTTVGTAALTTATWQAPTDALSPGQSCGKIVSSSAVQSALQLPHTVSAEPAFAAEAPSPAGFAAFDALGSLGCNWNSGTTPNGDATLPLGVGAMRWLPGGAWAWTQTPATSSGYGARTPLTVQGMAATDSAWIRCDTPKTTCYTDLLIGSNWLQFMLWGPDQTRGATNELTLDVPTASGRLAAAIVSSLGS